MLGLSAEVKIGDTLTRVISKLAVSLTWLLRTENIILRKQDQLFNWGHASERGHGMLQRMTIYICRALMCVLNIA